jgi:hypothetical protein
MENDTLSTKTIFANNGIVAIGAAAPQPHAGRSLIKE